MPVKNATIRVKAEGLESLDKAAAAIKKLDQVMGQSRRDMDRAAKVAQQQDKAGIDSTRAKARAMQELARLENQQRVMAMERAALSDKELINTRTRSIQAEREAEKHTRKTQQIYSDAMMARVVGDEKADRTLISRRQKSHESEHRELASSRAIVQKSRLTDLAELVDRENAKAKAFEKAQKEKVQKEKDFSRWKEHLESRNKALDKEKIAQVVGDEKAQSTLLERRQKRNDAEYKLTAAERARDRKERTADLNQWLQQENQKARLREYSATKRESLGGALSGFGGKMVLGMAAGRMAGDVLGPGAAMLGSIASGFMFGGPVIGGAVAGMEILGSAISGVRERQEKLTKSVQDYYAELAKLSVREQDAARSILPTTGAGRQLEQEREQIQAEKAERAEQKRREFEDIKSSFTGSLAMGWRLVSLNPFHQRNRAEFVREQLVYLKTQRDLAAQAKLRDEAIEAQRRSQDAFDNGQRISAVEHARSGLVPGERRRILEDELDATDRLREARYRADQELLLQQVHQQAQIALDKAIGEQTDLAAQKRDRDFLKQKTEKDIAAVQTESALKRQGQSVDFIYSERNRLSPVYQLKEYGIKLKEAVDQNATTIDQARMLMQRKVMELYSSVLAPHDFKVGDSRSRLNLAAMNPMMAMVMAGAKIPAYADGTDNHPGGPALVGERGPEVVHLPKGSRVDKYGVPSYATYAERARIMARYYSGTVGLRELKGESVRGIGTGAGMSADELERFWNTRAIHNPTAPELRRRMDTPAQHEAHRRAARGDHAPGVTQGGVHNPIFDGAGTWNHQPGYYQSHSMLARVRAGHHARRGGGAGLIDPLTGRALDLGSFSSMDSRGGGPGASMAVSGDLLRIAQQILHILQTHGVN